MTTDRYERMRNRTREGLAEGLEWLVPTAFLSSLFGDAAVQSPSLGAALLPHMEAWTEDELERACFWFEMCRSYHDWDMDQVPPVMLQLAAKVKAVG